MVVNSVTSHRVALGMFRVSGYAYSCQVQARNAHILGWVATHVMWLSSFLWSYIPSPKPYIHPYTPKNPHCMRLQRALAGFFLEALLRRPAVSDSVSEAGVEDWG